MVMLPLQMLPRAACALLLGAAAAQADTTVTILGGGKLVAAVGSSSSFRLGVSFETDRSRPGGATALPSASVEPTAPAPSSKVSWGGMEGIKTAFGALLVSPAGAWELFDEKNASVLKGTAPTLSTGPGVMHGRWRQCAPLHSDRCCQEDRGRACSGPCQGRGARGVSN